MAAVLGSAPSGSQLFPCWAWASGSLAWRNSLCLPVTLVPCLVPTLARNRLRGEASAGGGAGERPAERQMETGRDGKQPHSHIQPWAPQGPQHSAITKAPGLLLGQSSASAPRFSQETPLPALCLAWNSTERSGSRQRNESLFSLMLQHCAQVSLCSAWGAQITSYSAVACPL